MPVFVQFDRRQVGIDRGQEVGAGSRELDLHPIRWLI